MDYDVYRMKTPLFGGGWNYRLFFFAQKGLPRHPAFSAAKEPNFLHNVRGLFV